MLKSLTNLAGDVVKVVAAPVEIAADLARVVTKPAADVADELKTEVKALSGDVTKKG